MLTIIPSKPFDQSKTRLAPVLSERERADLSRRLLRRTIKLARHVSEVVVISHDASARRLAKRLGTWALVEAGTGLNKALRQATVWAIARGADSILVLPGDLPLLSRTNLTEMTKLGQRTPSLVIAPCHRREGTNALLLRPPGLIQFAFGVGSFEAHLRRAQAAQVEPIVYTSPLLGLDLDLPEDLVTLAQLATAGNEGANICLPDREQDEKSRTLP